MEVRNVKIHDYLTYPNGYNLRSTIALLLIAPLIGFVFFGFNMLDTDIEGAIAGFGASIACLVVIVMMLSSASKEKQHLFEISDGDFYYLDAESIYLSRHRNTISFNLFYVIDEKEYYPYINVSVISDKYKLLKSNSSVKVYVSVKDPKIYYIEEFVNHTITT